MPRRLAALAFVLAGANAALADNMKMPTDSGISNVVQHRPYCRKWQKSLVLSGDPVKDGPYVLGLKVPKGYRVPAHNHPTTTDW